MARRSHGVQGPERRLGSLKTRKEQSMMHVMSREDVEGLDCSGPCQGLVKEFCFILRAIGSLEE